MFLKLIQQIELYCNFETRLIYYKVTSVLVMLLLQTHPPRECFKKKLQTWAFALKSADPSPPPNFGPVQYGQISFLCTVHRNLCIVHTFLCTLHRKFWPFFSKTLNFHQQPRTENPTHFNVSDGEIAFLKVHFLLELLIHNFYIIMSRRKWNFKKAISPSEPLKCVRILVLGSK